jgi:hypothetical protein
LFYVWASLNCDPHICASWNSLDDRYVIPCPVIVWDESLVSFCLCCPQTPILPISASQIVRIIGLSHCAQPELIFFKYLLPLIFK